MVRENRPIINPRDPFDRGYMRTYTGKKFWPLDPRPEEVCIFDIAHANALKCRYGGHSRRFYSVNEHEVRMCWQATWPNKFATLLHDAGEGYFPDIIRPIKHTPEWEKFFRPFEHRLETVIAEALSVPFPFPAEVKELDRRILTNEMMELVPYGDWLNEDGSWAYAEPLPNIDGSSLGWSWQEAEERFLAMYEALKPNG